MTLIAEVRLTCGSPGLHSLKAWYLKYENPLEDNSGRVYDESSFKVG